MFAGCKLLLLTVALGIYVAPGTNSYSHMFACRELWETDELRVL